jgi:hypothetical protein
MNIEEMLEISDCPLCEGGALLEEECGCGYYVMCLECGCHSVTIDFHSEEERLEAAKKAVTLWNTGKVISSNPGEWCGMGSLRWFREEKTMEYCGIIALVLLLCYSAYPRKVKRLEAKVKQLEKKHKGDNYMSKLIDDLVGEQCTIKSESILDFAGKTELSCMVLDAD